MLDKKRLGTFVLGGLTGVIAGILLAPKSGRETRGDIANRAGEAGQRGRESYFDTEERFRERISATRDRTRKPPPPSATHEMPLGDPGPPPGAEPGAGEASSDASDVAEVAGGRPNLRDVSRESGSDARSEELRKKVRETRERIRSRMESEGTSGEGGDPDGGE